MRVYESHVDIVEQYAQAIPQAQAAMQQIENESTDRAIELMDFELSRLNPGSWTGDGQKNTIDRLEKFANGSNIDMRKAVLALGAKGLDALNELLARDEKTAKATDVVAKAKATIRRVQPVKPPEQKITPEPVERVASRQEAQPKSLESAIASILRS
jgi:hypothetical protein